MASTKKTATDATPAERKREVPKPKAERPKLRSSHGGATTAAKTTKSAKPRAADASAPKRVRPKAAAKAPLATRALAAAAGAPKSRRPRIAGTPQTPVSSSVASDGAREVAVAIAVAALDKKAHALEILDVAGKVDYADFLVLMSGKSDRQVAALAQGIEDALRRKGKHALSIEGLPHAVWVLMDFGDVVVHVFQEDSRQLYDLDGLWMDARRIPLPSDPEGPRSTAN